MASNAILGKLAGEMLEIATALMAYDTDPMSTHAPAECRVKHERACIRQARQLAQAGGFEDYEAFLDAVAGRTSDSWAFRVGLAALGRSDW